MNNQGESKKRLDVYLTEQGLALSRTHAQELIAAGQVFIIENNQRHSLKKSSQLVDGQARLQIEVTDGSANRFVSRGGLKLEGALKHLKLDVKGLNAVDIGLSTGGFADCLLQQNCASVVGVDVGHGQTHPRLLMESRLKILEGVNARSLSQNKSLQTVMPGEKFDLAVMDVSFISITLILPEVQILLKKDGCLLSLVKPQFEVGIDGLSKGGIVKDVALYDDVEKKVKSACQNLGFQILDYFSSPLQGKDGNNEFFVFAKKI